MRHAPSWVIAQVNLGDRQLPLEPNMVFANCMNATGDLAKQMVLQAMRFPEAGKWHVLTWRSASGELHGYHRCPRLGEGAQDVESVDVPNIETLEQWRWPSLCCLQPSDEAAWVAEAQYALALTDQITALYRELEQPLSFCRAATLEQALMLYPKRLRSAGLDAVSVLLTNRANILREKVRSGLRTDVARLVLMREMVVTEGAGIAATRRNSELTKVQRWIRDELREAGEASDELFQELREYRDGERPALSMLAESMTRWLIDRASSDEITIAVTAAHGRKFPSVWLQCVPTWQRKACWNMTLPRVLADHLLIRNRHALTALAPVAG